MNDQDSPLTNQPTQRLPTGEFLAADIAEQSTMKTPAVPKKGLLRRDGRLPMPPLVPGTSGEYPTHPQGTSGEHAILPIQTPHPQEASGVHAIPPMQTPRPQGTSGEHAILPTQAFQAPAFASQSAPQGALHDMGRRVDPNETWIPGTFGFNGTAKASPGEEELDAFPTMVLQGISNQQGQQLPVMKSEVSGAAGSAAIVGVGTVAGNFVKYGGTFLIQRGFGPGPYGLYSLCLSIVTLVSSIFNLGMDDAMIRYIAVYRGKKQPHLLRGLTIFCTVLAGGAGILGAIAVLFLAPYIANIKHSPGAVLFLQMMVPFIPLTCMQVVWSAGLQGFKAFKWRVITQRIIIPSVMFVLLAVVVLFFRFLFLNGVIIALLISTAVGAIVSLYFFFKTLRRVQVGNEEQYELREWLGFATPNFLTSVVDTVLESTDTLLLAFFAVSNVAIGLYSAAIRISIFIAVPLQSMNVMFTPTIAELYAKGDIEKLSAMFKIVTKWTITFSLPIFWIATLFAKSLLDLPSKGFGSAWPLLVAFSIGAIVNAGTGSVGYMLLMTGHQKLSFLNSLTAVVVNVILGVLLTPRYGAMGTAIATGLAIAVVNLMRLLQVRIFLKMQPYRLDTLKPIFAGLLSAGITGALLFYVDRLNIAFYVFRLVKLNLDLALIPVFLAGYVILLFCFKLDAEDRIVLDALRKKLKRGKK